MNKSNNQIFDEIKKTLQLEEKYITRNEDFMGFLFEDFNISIIFNIKWNYIYIICSINIDKYINIIEYIIKLNNIIENNDNYNKIIILLKELNKKIVYQYYISYNIINENNITIYHDNAAILYINEDEKYYLSLYNENNKEILNRMKLTKEEIIKNINFNGLIDKCIK